MWSFAKKVAKFWLRPLDRNWFSPVIAGTLINRWTRIHTNLWKRQVCVCDDIFSNKEKGFLFSFLIKSIPHFTCHQPFTTHNGHLAWTPSLLLVNVINCPWKFSSKNLLFSKLHLWQNTKSRGAETVRIAYFQTPKSKLTQIDFT